MMEDNNFNAIRRSRLFSGLSEREKKRIFADITSDIKQFDKGEIILHEGQVFNSVYLIAEGAVAGEKYDIEGNVNILNVYSEGEIMGIEIHPSTEKTAPCSYIAIKNSTVIVLPISRILNCEYREVILENVIGILADENIKRMYKIDILSKKGLRQRILTFLIIMKNKQDCNPFNVHMNQEQMAQYLCVNRSALSLELNKMKKEHIIDFKRSVFTLLIEER